MIIAVIAIRAFVVPPATTSMVAGDVVVVVLAGMVGVCVCSCLYVCSIGVCDSCCCCGC